MESQRQEPERHMVITRSTSLSLTGETPEDSIPACRVEADDTLEMPSVKDLLSKFKRTESEPSASSVNRVYSLTGRDLPKTIREKLKHDHTTPNTTPDASQPRRRLDEIFQEGDGTAAPPATPATAPPIKDDAPVPSDAKWTPVEKEKTFVTSSAKWTPKDNTPTASSVKRTLMSPRSQPSSEGRTSPKRAKETSSGSKPGRNSAIMARAAFWDSRISEGKASDKEVPIEKFPELSKDMFKSADEVFY
ncbi:hypothetical protein LSAT2_002071 [Lamellibrachia satsuma]|nr:hypothetical protein LSAT2_002071 [Lamellibrachia satsuma]